ncbi:MAG: hypothetical protein R3348_08490 [Xanthomonadales bacterium]|nr:hypothetical protein [Xanthomonadales bacterium]
MNLLSDDRLCPDRSVIDLNRRTKIIHRLDELLWRSDWSEARVPRDVASEVELYVHPEGMPWFANTIENILRLLVAFDALNRGAVLLHSAALVRDGRAAVLFGHSGAGKSTTSGIGLEAGCSIVSDDINLLEASNRGWQVRPVPFSGTLNALSDISTPVRVHGLFHLHKSDRHEARPCSTARAVALLAASAPFVNQDPFSTDHLMEIAGDLVRQFGVSELRFARDPGFLNLAFASPEMQP